MLLPENSHAHKRNGMTYPAGTPVQQQQMAQSPQLPPPMFANGTTSCEQSSQLAYQPQQQFVPTQTQYGQQPVQQQQMQNQQLGAQSPSQQQAQYAQQPQYANQPQQQQYVQASSPQQYVNQQQQQPAQQSMYPQSQSFADSQYATQYSQPPQYVQATPQQLPPPQQYVNQQQPQPQPVQYVQQAQGTPPQYVQQQVQPANQVIQQNPSQQAPYVQTLHQQPVSPQQQQYIQVPQQQQAVQYVQQQPQPAQPTVYVAQPTVTSVESKKTLPALPPNRPKPTDVPQPGNGGQPNTTTTTTTVIHEKVVEAVRPKNVVLFVKNGMLPHIDNHNSPKGTLLWKINGIEYNTPKSGKTEKPTWDQNIPLVNIPEGVLGVPFWVKVTHKHTGMLNKKSEYLAKGQGKLDVSCSHYFRINLHEPEHGGTGNVTFTQKLKGGCYIKGKVIVNGVQPMKGKSFTY